MIKNTHKAITDYAEAYRQAKDVHKQAFKYIKDNYKEGSEMFKSAKKTADDTLLKAVTPMKDICMDSFKQDFEQVRKQIQQIVTVAPSSELLGILPMIQAGKLNEAELQMFTDKFKGNYMDAKLLADATGQEFTTVENIMEEIDNLEEGVQKYFDTFTGESLAYASNNNANLLHGGCIEAVDNLTDEFIKAYAVQEGGE